MPLITRQGKGSKLTIQEMDDNLLYLSGSIASGGLGGTQYTYVAANGTPEENAAELQAAYDLAKTKVLNQTIYKPSFNVYSGNITVSGGSFSVSLSPPLGIDLFSNPGPYDVKITGIETTVTYAGGGAGTYVFSTTLPDGTYNLNFDSSNFLWAFISAIPSTVVVSPGLFDFSSNFLVDTDYVNIVSLDGNRSIIFSGDGTIDVSADGCLIKGVDVVDKRFIIGDNLSNLTVENCKGGDYSFTGTGPGESANPIVISGTFINCEGGEQSFGYQYDTVSGTFTGCKVRSGFGYFCAASGIFEYCEAYNNAFGRFSTASGTFNNCTITSGAGFGASGTASGTFNYCVSSNAGFGSGGTLIGKVFYCRMANGLFPTVSGNGIVRVSFDGNNNENNQG